MKTKLRIQPRLIWTEGYRPFIFGGSCYYPLMTTVDCEGPFDLGKGYLGWVTYSPLTGNCYVAEDTTGAIVGHSITAVRKDIKEGDPKVMREQVANAQRRISNPLVNTEVEPAEFWKMIRGRA